MKKEKVPAKNNRQNVWKVVWKKKEIYLMVLPVLLFYLLFCYKPMYGIVIAFMNYKPRLGISGSEWVGLLHFKNFFSSYYFWRLIRNTLTISITSLIFSFPAPIILALLMNELKNKRFMKLTQTITYLPHFISTVVVCSIIREFVSTNGLITNIFTQFFGYSGGNMLANSKLFVPIYVISGIWQTIGWNSIVYLAALSSVDAELYDAAAIDGANRWQQTLHVTLPGILPTIVVMLILRMGSVMSVGYEKVMLLYNEGIYNTADVISTYVYRTGLVNQQYSYSTAVGLFNSVINLILVVAANQISKKVTETSLW